MARKMSSRASLVCWLTATCALSGCSARPSNGEITHVRCVLHNGILTEVRDRREVTETDTLLIIEGVDRGTDQQDRIPYHRWVVDNERFLFRGERYLLGPRGLGPIEFPARATDRRIVPVGEHDNVTLYAWRSKAADTTIITLFVRGVQSPCDMWKYLHISEIRH